MAKKKTTPKKSVAQKATVKKITLKEKIKYSPNNPNFLILLLAGSIIVIVFLFNFL